MPDATERTPLQIALEQACQFAIAHGVESPKDLHVISWSWWWVMTPVWGPSALAVLILIGAIVGFGASAIWKTLRRRSATT